MQSQPASRPEQKRRLSIDNTVSPIYRSPSLPYCYRIASSWEWVCVHSELESEQSSSLRRERWRDSGRFYIIHPSLVRFSTGEAASFVILLTSGLTGAGAGLSGLVGTRLAPVGEERRVDRGVCCTPEQAHLIIQFLLCPITLPYPLCLPYTTHPPARTLISSEPTSQCSSLQHGMDSICSSCSCSRSGRPREESGEGRSIERSRPGWSHWNEGNERERGGGGGGRAHLGSLAIWQWELANRREEICLPSTVGEGRR